jgi:hypothetical protein
MGCRRRAIRSSPPRTGSMSEAGRVPHRVTACHRRPERHWMPVNDQRLLNLLVQTGALVRASQHATHAEPTAVTKVGPATVEQLTADVERLGRGM